MGANKIISADQAAALVRSGDLITTSGFVGIGVPDELLSAVEKGFLATGEPKGLSLLFAAGQGDGKERGLNRLGHPGLIKRAVGGHWGLIPKMAQLAVDGEIEAYNLPQGCISHLYRDIAAGKPGMLSKVGLGTFVDPRLDGGKINDVTQEDLVELLEVGNEEFLFYKTMPIDVALLRGTTADEAGNVSMEKEALILDNLAQAMAAKNSGGLVIVQVERIVEKGSLLPRDVVLPKSLVDAIVVATPENHAQTYATDYSHAFSGRFRAPAGAVATMPLGDRKIVARRCAFELPINGVVNLGIGMPDGVASVAAEEGLTDHVTLTTEPGVIGGRPASGLDFGAATNTDAIIAQNAQFDFYDGGGLDLTCLGMAQTDAQGNVNVSRFGPRLAGAGGFINISQNAKKVVFAGTFTAGGLEVAVRDGALEIVREGRTAKFLEHVEQVTFAGARAAAQSKPVLYVTERCVFELTANGLLLVEVAPGIDVDRDILAHMGFEPIVEAVSEMDSRIFTEDRMDLAADLLHLDLPDRIAFDPVSNILFNNFENLRVRNMHDVERVRDRVREVCEPLGRHVDVVVNYDNARIDESMVEPWAAMVAELEGRYYGEVSRYAGCAFMRMKLGRAFADRAVPNVFETAEEAHAFLGRTAG